MTIVRRYLLGAAMMAAAMGAGCSRGGIDYAQGRSMTGGDPEAGKQAIVMHDCHSCHVIPGIEGDAVTQGPELAHWAKRRKVAGEWPNTPENLENWIRHSEQLRPRTTMKLMTVNEKDARDIAAYLYSLN